MLFEIIIFLLINNIYGKPSMYWKLGCNDRPEYVHARIRNEDINSFKPNNIYAYDRMKQRIKALGDDGDVCGYIVPHEFGGPLDYWNLYPQNCKIDCLALLNNFEYSIRQFLYKYQSKKDFIDIKYKLVYLQPLETRPVAMQIEASFYINNELTDVENVLNFQKIEFVTTNPYKILLSN